MYFEYKIYVHLLHIYLYIIIYKKNEVDKLKPRLYYYKKRFKYTNKYYTFCAIVLSIHRIMKTRY